MAAGDILHIIEQVKAIQQEHRPARDEELEALSRWYGWGALAPAFTPHPRDEWKELAVNLRLLLGPEGFKAASAATTSSYFTDPFLIDLLWQIAIDLGFSGGKVLEVGCGSGSFMARAPEGLPCVFTGIEREPFSASIAQIRVPKARILTAPLEKVVLVERAFDFAIGNLPFGDIPIFDPETAGYTLHNYCIRRISKALRPGGIAVLLTSRYTLDALRDTQRRRLARNIALLGAIRLPSGAHRQAGTEAVSDILVLQRPYPTMTWRGHSWTTSSVVPEVVEGEPVNEYFVCHPGQVVGQMSTERHGLYRNEELSVRMPEDYQGKVQQAERFLVEEVRAFGAGYVPPPDYTHIDLEAAEISLRQDGKHEGSFYVVDGTLMQVKGGDLQPVTRNAGELLALVRLRDAALSLIEAEHNLDTDDSDLLPAREALNRAYDEYVAQYGPVHRARIIYGKTDEETGEPSIQRRRPPALSAFRDDPDYPVVLGLEEYDDTTGVAKKTEIFTRRIHKCIEQKAHADSPAEAIALCLDRYGFLDMSVLAGLLNVSCEDAVDALGDLIYLNPETDRWETASEYLSGEVVSKLEYARARAERDPRFARNVAALEKVVPEPLVPGQIYALPGASWIPPRDIEQFCQEVFGMRADITFEPRTSTWEVFVPTYVHLDAKVTSEWGTSDKNAFELLEAALNRKMVQVIERIDGRELRNQDATLAAQEKQTAISERFSAWVWEDDERAERLAAAYNRMHRSTVPRTYDGSHLTFPGMNEVWKGRLYRWQKDFIWRMVCSKSALCGYPVGAGKCLAADSIIYDPRTGLPHTLEEVVRHSSSVTDIWTLADQRHITTGPIADRIDSGIQPTLRITFSSGRSVVTTPHHPFLTSDGWRRADQIAVGEMAALPAIVPFPQEPVAMDRNEIDLLAIHLASGGMTKDSALSSTGDETMVAVGRSAAKEMPNRVYRLGPEDLGRFLGVFWMCTGSVDTGGPAVVLASETFVRSLQHLLLRFGIQSRVEPKQATSGGKVVSAWRLTVYASSMERFAEVIDLWGDKRDRLMAHLARTRPSTGGRPTVSDRLCTRSKELASPFGGGADAVHVVDIPVGPQSGPALRRRLPLPFTTTLSRERAGGANASSEIFWDRVVSIEVAGTRQVYDLTVLPTHTFLANDIIVHNTTIEIAGAITLRRFGMTQRAAIIVPNHLLEQIAGEVSRLYPTAKVLLIAREDLSRERRKLFLAKIATGEYDIVVMTHGSFGAIPVRPETESAYLDERIASYRQSLLELTEDLSRKTRRTIKRVEKAIYRMEQRQLELMQMKRDDGLSFEQVGITYLIVDEAHLFKNLDLPTSCDGLGIRGSKRASDLEMKVRWLEKHQEGKPFASFFTATPVANSIVEAYVMGWYLRKEWLEAHGMPTVDAFASLYIQFSTQVEVSPDGASFRLHTRPRRYVNQPEFHRFLADFADLRPPSILDEKRPGRQDHLIIIERDKETEEYVNDLVIRSDLIHQGRPRAMAGYRDNMLCVSTDGKRGALDLSLVGRAPERHPKLEAVAREMLAVYQRNQREMAHLPGEHKSLQIGFCDLGTPSKEKGEQCYGLLKKMLAEGGIPRSAIRFIHEAKTDAAKARLFEECRNGSVAILLGSTEKLGTGANIQSRCVAVHLIDVVWRPDMDEQRIGRCHRPGNCYPLVHVFRYVQERTFDAYSYQTLFNKAVYFDQLRSGNLTVREVDALGEVALTYAQVKAAATGDPLVEELAEAEVAISALERLQNAHARERSRDRREAETLFSRARSRRAEASLLRHIDAEARTHPRSLVVGDTVLAEANAIGASLTRAIQESLFAGGGRQQLGTYAGVPLSLSVKIGEKKSYSLSLIFGHPSEKETISILADSAWMHKTRQAEFKRALDDLINGASARAEQNDRMAANEEQQALAFERQSHTPFARATELARLRARAGELHAYTELVADAKDDPARQNEIAAMRTRLLPSRTTQETSEVPRAVPLFDLAPSPSSPQPTPKAKTRNHARHKTPGSNVRAVPLFPLPQGS